MNEELRKQIAEVIESVAIAAERLRQTTNQVGNLDSFRNVAGMPRPSGPFDVCKNSYIELCEIMHSLRRLSLELEFFTGPSSVDMDRVPASAVQSAP